MPNTTKDAGRNSSPIGTQRYQPNRKGYRKQGRPAKRWEDDINTNLHPRDNNDLTTDPKWDFMENDSVSSTLRQPTRPTTPSPRLRQHDQQRTNKQRTRLKPMIKTKAALMTRTKKKRRNTTVPGLLSHCVSCRASDPAQPLTERAEGEPTMVQIDCQLADEHEDQHRTVRHSWADGYQIHDNILWKERSRCHAALGRRSLA